MAALGHPSRVSAHSPTKKRDGGKGGMGGGRGGGGEGRGRGLRRDARTLAAKLAFSIDGCEAQMAVDAIPPGGKVLQTVSGHSNAFM